MTAAVVLALVGVVTLWSGVRSGGGLARLDPAVVAEFAHVRARWLVTALTAVTDVGSPVSVTVLLLAVTLAVTRRARDWRPAVVPVVGLAVVVAVDVVVKHLVARPRPPVELHAVAATGLSFPSGHATISAGAVLLALWVTATPSGGRPCRRRAVARAVTVVAAAVFVLAVGTTRIVLGVHYPSDVLAGWCLAVGAVGAVALVAARPARAPATSTTTSRPLDVDRPPGVPTPLHGEAAGPREQSWT